MRRMFSLAFFFCFTQHSLASSSVLEMKTVIQAAMKSAPSLETIRAGANKIEGKASANVGIFDPTLSAHYKNKDGYYQREFQSIGVEQLTPFWGTKLYTNYRKSAGTIPIYELADETLNRGEWSAGATIPILKGGLTDEYRTKLGASRKESESAQFSLKNSELEIARITSNLYWDWVLSGHRYQINQALYQLALDRDRQIRLRADHGDIPAIEKDENRRSILQREALALAAYRAFQKTALDLSLFYRGQNGESVIPTEKELPASISLPPSPALEDSFSMGAAVSQKVLPTHPNWGSLQALEDKANIELKWARVQHLPELNMKLATSQDRGEGSKTLQSREFIFGLQLEMPLFFRSARGEIASSSAEISRIEANKRLFQDQLQIRITDSLQSLQNNQERVQILAQEVQATSTVEQAERIRFQHGDSTLLMVNLREQMTADAKIKEIQARSEYWKSWVDNQLNMAIRFWE